MLLGSQCALVGVRWDWHWVLRVVRRQLLQERPRVRLSTIT